MYEGYKRETRREGLREGEKGDGSAGACPTLRLPTVYGVNGVKGGKKRAGERSETEDPRGGGLLLGAEIKIETRFGENRTDSSRKSRISPPSLSLSLSLPFHARPLFVASAIFKRLAFDRHFPDSRNVRKRERQRRAVRLKK